MQSPEAEEPFGPTAEWLSELARRYGIYVLGGVVASGGSSNKSKPRNEALLLDPAGRMLWRYAKMHLFGFAGESEHYSAGDVPGKLPLPGCPAQVAICYDLRFPELFRLARGAQPELLIFIANWPAARESHWLALLRARAMENQAYVAAVNRCGTDPNVDYSGRSQIIDPKGEILRDPGNDEGVIQANLNLEALRPYRQAFPALSDIRDDLTRRDESRQPGQGVR